jgi:hypothetical protein
MPEPEKFDIMGAAGLGTNTIDQSVLGLPMLQIIQKGSPQVDATHKRYAEAKIDGAKAGNILFVRENKVIAQPLTVIPLGQSTCYTIWRPLAAGGGFIGIESLTITGDSRYHRGIKGTPNENKEYLGDNEAVLTVYLLVYFLDGAEWKQGLIAFTGTALRSARVWSRQLLSMKHPEMPVTSIPPIFSSKWLLTTKVEQNAKGSWFGWNIAKGDFLDTTKDKDLFGLANGLASQAIKTLPHPGAVPALPAGDSAEAGGSTVEPY